MKKRSIISVFISVLIFMFSCIPAASAMDAAMDVSDLVLGCDVSDLNGFNEESFEAFLDEKDIRFCLIRVGGRGFTQGSLYQDDFWKTAAKVCEKKEIPFGVYLYSSAINKEEAKEEATYLKKVAKELKDHTFFNLGIVLDIEQRRGARTEEVLGPQMGKLAQYQVKHLKKCDVPVWIYADTDTYRVCNFDQIKGCQFWLAKPVQDLEDSFDFGSTPAPEHGHVLIHQIDLGVNCGVDLNVMKEKTLNKFV